MAAAGSVLRHLDILNHFLDDVIAPITFDSTKAAEYLPYKSRKLFFFVVARPDLFQAQKMGVQTLKKIKQFFVVNRIVVKNVLDLSR